MSPEVTNVWGTHELPCACFFYSRVSDFAVDETKAEIEALYSDEDVSATEESSYSPSAGAALAWRYVGLCHMSFLLRSLEKARNAAKWYDDDAQSAAIGSLTKGMAPSFQGAALGPALFLASQPTRRLPDIPYDDWISALSSGDPDELMRLLQDSGLKTSLSRPLVLPQ